MTLDTVRVPKDMEPLFERAEQVVSAFFGERADRPEQGTIEIYGERYILVRAASLSVEFFGTVREIFGGDRRAEADDFARNILFDLAHAIGKSDARNFHSKMHLEDPIARLSAGPVHFAHAGWAFVDILPDSVAGDADEFALIYDHPYSFESDAWGRAEQGADFPVCIMNAGYSSGWCEESFGIELVSSEVLCKARGDHACRFVMAHPDHIEQRVAAYGATLDEHAGSLAQQVPDLFARKRLEDELRRAHGELEARVAQRTEALRTANDRLLEEMAERAAVERRLIQSQKLEALGLLAGGIAHDFNNLLTAIGGYAELLQDQLGSDDKRGKLAEEILRNTERASKLTQKLLVFSRQKVFSPRVIDVNLVVDRLGDLLRRLIGEEVRLEVVTATERLCARMDPNQLETALINLVVNARDAMRPSGGFLEIRVDGLDGDDASADTPSPGQAPDRVRIAIRDTGAGMDADTLARAFDPFFTTKGVGEGTGLGLSTVYGIAQQAGGSVKAESAVGQGTVVTLFLPRVFGPPDSERPQGEHPGPRPLEQCTVLVLEDEAVVRELVARVLTEAGCKVVAARDADEARQAFRVVEECDLVISDVILPGISGPELVAELRAQQPALEVLYVSGYTGDRIDPDALEAEGASFLQKPFTVGQLLATIEAILGEAE